MDDLSQLPTVLSLPASLPYPLTIAKLVVKPGDRVERGQTVLRYSYVSETGGLQDTTGDDAEDGPKRSHRATFAASWESPIDGEVVQWEDGLRERMILPGPGPILHIQEECSHPIQFSGMCAVCGKDLSRLDYLHDNSSRAGPSSSKTGVEISHDSSKLTVSLDEAHRLALKARQELLSAKKLILVVDLDQTIIHAAVDPTIGEWMDECFGKGHNVIDLDGRETLVAKPVEGGTTNSSKNPNADALQDVFRFQLDNELPPELKGKVRRAFRANLCWYYIKPRPGLPAFLDKLNEQYEMHVYTAGSRDYADAVCKGIDPNGKYFNERILSRDESGTQKDLRRLFPTDQSMVVVIDDRWEVWNHAPNLVKVVPYDFFVGMGDINAAYVSPRAIDEAPSSPAAPATIASPTAAAAATADEDQSREDLLAIKQAQDLEDQLESRPLKRLQEELEAKPEAEAGERSSTPEADSPPAEPKAVLKTDDRELQRLEHILNEVHGRFFDAFSRTKEGWRVPPSAEANPKILFDVRFIVPHMQRKVLAGCVILFSGIIPNFQKPETNEFWILATMFGAKCVKSLGPHVTHVVTAQATTEKVYHALRLPLVKVVWKEWLKHSIDMWQRQDDERYLVKRDDPQAKAGAVAADAAPLAEGGPPVADEGEADEEEEEEDVEEDPVELDQSELDEMDEELREFLDGASDSDSSRPTTPTRKRPRSSLLNPNTDRTTPSPTRSGRVPGRPTPKRARFEADQKDDEAEEYDDAVNDKTERDYDEYNDEEGVETPVDDSFDLDAELQRELAGAGDDASDTTA